MKYFAYVRKSSEGEERQALSIDSQKDKAKEFFSGLDIVEILEERHSAFKPYNRPVFADMIRRIERGEAQGIIAWHPDRLSRNEIDASTITYLVRTGVIHDLKFGSYHFDNSPEGIMMLQLALSQSQYFSSKLGKDVKRGLEKKISMGWRPGVAPEGYLNDISVEKGLRTVIIDPVRFPVIRKAFDLFLTGTKTAQEVLDILNNEWGYTTRQKKKSGGGKLARAVWYKMLNSSFYAGVITYGGKETEGIHQPLITIDEFNRIQELLGLRGCKKKAQKREFTFGGMFKCGACLSSITAEHKTKYIKCDKEVRSYDYYHCTHKRKDVVCHEGSVIEETISENITKKLIKLEMHPIFLQWALEYLDSQKGVERVKDKQVEATKEVKTKELESQLSGLTMMRAKNLLDDEEYLKEKTTIKNELAKIAQTPDTQENIEREIELTKEKFVFCFHALENFNNGNHTIKKEVLADLGSNREIQGKKVLISPHKWLLPIYNNAETHNEKLARLEPDIYGYDYRKSDALASLNLSWRRGRDSNPRLLAEHGFSRAAHSTTLTPLRHE